MNIIIAGAGEVGTHLAKMMTAENHHVTIIDADPARIRRIQENTDVLSISGSPTSFEVLAKADIKKTDLLIAVTPEEDTNLVTALLGKKMGALKVIARIDHSEYLEQANREMFQKMGVDYMFYPEQIASREIVNLLSQTSSTEFIDFSNGLLSLHVFRLDETTPFLGKTLIHLRKLRPDPIYTVVAVSRGLDAFIPDEDTEFMVNDMIYVMGTKEGIDIMMQKTGKQNFDVKNLMILGGSRIGMKVASELEKDMNIKMIESDPNRCKRLNATLNDTLIVTGDGRNAELLMEEELPNMDAFVAVTGNSETNILACLLAKKLGVQRTIAEIENLDYLDLAESIGIDTIINKKLITAGRIFRFTMNTDVQAINYLAGLDAEVLEYIAKSGSVATMKPVGEIRLPQGAVIGGIIRGNESFMPKEDTQIKPYDRVVIFAFHSAIKDLSKFFK